MCAGDQEHVAALFFFKMGSGPLSALSDALGLCGYNEDCVFGTESGLDERRGREPVDSDHR